MCVYLQRSPQVWHQHADDIDFDLAECATPLSAHADRRESSLVCGDDACYAANVIVSPAEVVVKSRPFEFPHRHEIFTASCAKNRPVGYAASRSRGD